MGIHKQKGERPGTLSRWVHKQFGVTRVRAERGGEETSEVARGQVRMGLGAFHSHSHQLSTNSTLSEDSSPHLLDGNVMASTQVLSRIGWTLNTSLFH